MWYYTSYIGTTDVIPCPDDTDNPVLPPDAYNAHNASVAKNNAFKLNFSKHISNIFNDCFFVDNIGSINNALYSCGDICNLS